MPPAPRRISPASWRSAPARAARAISTSSTGSTTCQRNHVPVLAIAAHIPSSEIGTGYFQETHPQELFKECSVYCELVSSPEQMPQVFDIAMRTAILKKGVAVVVVLPGDVALKPMPEGIDVRWKAPAPALTRPGDADIDRLAALLNDGKKITILAGAGCAGGT